MNRAALIVVVLQLTRVLELRTREGTVIMTAASRAMNVTYRDGAAGTNFSDAVALTFR